MENNIKLMVIYGDLVMNKEDYFKYYIQGSDHYLIPKDIFIELFDEMENWREEAKELKKQLEEYQEELEKADSITQSCIFNGKKESEISYRKCLNMLEKHKNQQKEFIDYMNKTIEELECDDVDDEERKGYLIQRIDIYKEILSKYKSIIGGKDAIK